MSEPTRLTAGMAVAWSRASSLADGVRTFTYRLVSSTGKIDIATVSADGQIAVDVTSAESSNWDAGQYKWFLLVDDAGEASILAQGFIEIAANPLTLTTLNSSTHNERMLAAIEAKLEGRISTDHERYSIDGRSLDRIPIEQLSKLQKEYKWKVHHERIAKGLRNPNNSVRYR